MAFTDRNAAYDLSLFEEDEAYVLAKAESQYNIIDIELLPEIRQIRLQLLLQCRFLRL